MRKMDCIESAGEIVLLSYGQLLDSLGTQLFKAREKLPYSVDCIPSPVEIEVEHGEHSHLCDLVETDSRIQNKILIVFARVCNEISILEGEALKKFLPGILFYGDGCSIKGEKNEFKRVANELLPLLVDLLCFVRRCRHVLVHCLQQLRNVYKFSWKGSSINDRSFMKFQEVFSSLGTLLTLFVSLDSVITNNKIIEAHYSMLKQNVSSFNENDSSIDMLKLQNLTKILMEIHTELFIGQIFQNSINLQFERSLGNIDVLTNPLNSYIRHYALEIEGKKEADYNTLILWSNIVVTYAFSVQMFGVTDKKLHKIINDASKKHIAGLLFGDILWLPAEFLGKQLENRNRDSSLRMNQYENTLFTYLDQTGMKLTKEVKSFSFQTYKWMLQVENSISIDSMYMKLRDIDTVHLCLEGIQLSKQMKYLINYVSNLHTALGKPMTKTSAICLCKLIELMKGIQSVFNRQQILMAKFLNHAIQKLAVRSLHMIIRSKEELIKKKSCSETHVDSYYSLLLAEKILFGVCTEDRLLLTRLALTVTSNPQLISDGNFPFSQNFTELSAICSLKDKLQEAATCNFLFTERHIFSIYLKYLIDSQSDLSRLQYILHSWEDGYTSEISNEEIVDNLFLLTHRQLNSVVLKQLCQEVETNLRLQVHSHLQADCIIPVRTRNYRKLLRVSPMVMFQNVFSIKGQVENYLDKTFYDLTTVALHDWHTYKKMRNLAEHKFFLQTVEDNLPSQSISQGLDVLEIMRNINIFVSKYLYNLNNQCFIENGSNNKHLNTIKINQIANSIWTHGIGIMNTTANFIYQFLRKKLLIFSQFLYDDNIKSRLMKDLNYFLENKTNHGSKYPYERAEKFNKGIGRLGVNQDGLTYLDQFRILISHIGNALGYVRMMRAGGLHHCLGASAYLPSLEVSALNTNYNRSSTNNAVSCFNTILMNMLHNLTEGTEYFKLLADVFTTVFCSPENCHLRLFVMIVPPLSINFVNHIITAKERMKKRNREGALFTDDGFVMGVAYLLCILDAYQEFDALHWFDSIKDRYEEEENIILKRASKENKEDKYENTLKLSIKRLQMYKQEFDLLQYNLKSARVLFRRDQSTIPGH